jgi:hypothetical protein
MERRERPGAHNPESHEAKREKESSIDMAV